MNDVSSHFARSVQPRFLALSLPRLSTDRIRRETLGRAWRCSARRDDGASGRLSSEPGRTGIDRGRLDTVLRPPNRARYETRGFAEAASALERETGGTPLAPLALYETIANANRISAVCEMAAAGGLSPGVGLAEARARFPGLDIILADPGAEARLLTALADWCDRYTPLVALDPPQGLVLDISGCAHLFGGEKALMDDLLARLFQQGFAANAAIASHAGTALALVGHDAPHIVAAGEECAAIAPLPISALRLDAALAAMLRRLGLKTVGALSSLRRAGLTRRFGEDLVARLDEAAGRVFRPISPRRPIPELAAERRLFEPISRVEDVERVLFLLAERLKDDLARRGVGARRLELSLFRVDGKVNRLAVGASRPVREPGHMQRLFRERMKGLGEEFDAGYGYDLVKLAVFEAAPMPDVQTDLSGSDAAVDAFGNLVDRLGARLGEASVLRLEVADSHWPERAERWLPVNAGAGGALAAFQNLPPASAPRPVRLLALPEPIEASFEVPDGAPLQFRWRRALHVVRRAEGPERIGVEWWRDASEAARDYYRIEDADGRRFWLFREGFADPAVDPEWQRPAPRPAWYLHGIFA